MIYKPDILESMPKMIPLPLREEDDHRRWQLIEDWSFYFPKIDRRVHFLKEFIFNGASVPPLFSNIFPSTGHLFIAALPHDHIYQHQYVWLSGEDGDLYRFWFNRKDADQFFADVAYWLYPKKRVKTWTAKAALYVGGQAAWDKCRKADGTYVEPDTIDYDDDHEVGG